MPAKFPVALTFELILILFEAVRVSLLFEDQLILSLTLIFPPAFEVSPLAGDLPTLLIMVRFVVAKEFAI